MDRAQATGLVKENLKNMPQAAEKAVDEAKSYTSQGMDYAKSGLKTLRESTGSAVSSTSDIIKENPFYAILGAAALGVVVGFMLRRPSKD